jgi:cytosine/adenosine deaminase-related metal-dependent hydrolase
MGSAGGAKALGLDATVGSIEEGKKADLTVLNPAISLAPNNALIDELALCENGASVESVFVDGIAVLLERKITGVDEAALRAELAKMEPKIARAKAAALQSQGH